MNVVIIGLGMVGFGLYEQLINNPSELNLHGVMDHNDKLVNSLGCKVYKTIDEVVLDKNVDIVVELIGGLDPATEFIQKALSHGKHVVTANKAVVSKHYQALHKLAKENDVIFRYEASVGGGIIILDPLEQLSKLAYVKQMFGIINGSTNFILSKVFNDDLNIEAAITLANRLGYLETGTTDDMDGLDLMRKINIMSMMAYQGIYQEEKIIRMPLNAITDNMINYAKKHDKMIKYLAFSIRDTAIFVAPFLLPKTSQLANVNEATNQIHVYSETSDWLVFEGQGAGRYPTSTAVLYDLYQLLRQQSYHVNLDHQLVFDQSINLFDMMIETKSSMIKTISKNEASKAINNPDTKAYMFIWEDLK